MQKLRYPSIKLLMAKVTIQDVARVAGVSVATVDRVLNRRPGVRGVTVTRVEGAIRDLNYQPDRIAARLARSREYRFCFVLPDRSGDFWERINEEVRTIAERMAGERVSISIKRVDVFDGVQRRQQFGLACARCGSAHVDTRYGAVGHQDDGAAGGPA